MKKLIIAAIILSVAALSFIAGGWYGTTGTRRFRHVRSTSPAPRLQALPNRSSTDDRTGRLGGEMAPGAVRISPARQQLIGVKVAAVEKKPMTYTLRLYGRVVPDETRIYRLNASTDSWIREISGVTTGSLVEKNEILAEMLAPALFNAQSNLRDSARTDGPHPPAAGRRAPAAAERDRRQPDPHGRAEPPDPRDSDAQIAELAKTRKARPYLQVRAPAGGVVLSRKVTLNQWFKAGEEFYTIADIGKVWVYADVYEDEAMHMRPGMTVAVRHGQMGRTFSAKIGQVLPLFDPRPGR